MAISVEEYREKHAKPRMRKSFDGEAAIRNRLGEMKIEFREQVVFSKVKGFRADFVIEVSGGPCIIEYSGATYVKGGHTSGKGVARDAEKMNLAVCEGFRYLVFTVDLLRKPYYFEDTVRAIMAGLQTGKCWKDGKGR